MSHNPVQDFLKYSSSTRVKSHTRNVAGKTVQVSEHDRDTEDDARKAELAARQSRELEMWRKWKDGGMKHHDLRPLLKSFKPMIMSKANVYKGKVRLPPSAIELEFQKQFVLALRSYDPEKGSLGTYVYRYLDKAKRWIGENQNVGRIPENRVYKIKEYTNTRDDMHDKLGRPPTEEELAKELNWSVAEVDRMSSEIRNDLMTQAFEEDPTVLAPSKVESVLKDFKYELSGEQKAVYEYLTGYGKPRITSTGEIAKRLKMKDYQVSRIKNQIEVKLRRHLNG